MANKDGARSKASLMLVGMGPFARRALFALSLPCLGCWLNASARASTKQVDAIVVLGHRPARDEGEVEYETRARVERGVALWREQRSERLLFTGGTTTPGEAEADVMASYAESLGAPSEALLRERASRDTIENARLSLALLRGRLPHAVSPRILLVTSDYHIERAAELFRCAGAEVETSPVQLDVSRWRRFRQRARELMVRVVYWFVDECERARG